MDSTLAEHAMTTNDPDPRAPSDPASCEALARLLGDPLPADWRDPSAITARQDHLAAIAAIAGEAALECVVRYVDLRQQDPQRTKLAPEAPELHRFGAEMLALAQCLRRYAHETQRSDGPQIIMEALTCSAGATVATAVDGVLDQIIREVRTGASDQLPDAGIV